MPTQHECDMIRDDDDFVARLMLLTVSIRSDAAPSIVLPTAAVMTCYDICY